MRLMTELACAALLFSPLLAQSATAEPRYRLNKAQTRVVSLTGLSSGGMCQPFKTNGRVTEQRFEGPRVVGFTLAEKGGSRSYINVEPINLDNADNMLAVGWINQGLQQMLRKGNRVALRVDACGAAGRVLVLDSVRLQ